MSEPDENPDENQDADEGLPPKPGREKAMGFWDHLEELRWTIVKSVVVFLIFAVGLGFFFKDFNSIIMWPMHKVQAEYPDRADLKLVTHSVMEGFNTIIQVCVFGGLGLALPFILIFVGQFVAPALTEKELKAVIPMALAATFLFVSGSVFSYFLLMPSTVRMSIEATTVLDAGINWSVGSYYSTFMWLVFGVGLSFEFPLVIILLVWLGIMTTAFLRKYRRHAIVVIFFIAAVVTPTADPLTQTIFAAPLYVLFEAAVIVSARVEKRRAAQLRT